jgi:hypothetical protein
MIERQLGGSVLTLGAWGSRSREPDLLRAEAIARHGCIIRELVGSRRVACLTRGPMTVMSWAYASSRPEYVAGLRSFERWVFRT